MSLSPGDRELVDVQPFDPDASIAFHELLGCLVWSDEVPDGLTSAGRDYLRELLAVRGILHLGRPVDWPDGTRPDRAAAWRDALDSDLRWNGFRRIELTPEQRRLLEHYASDDGLP
jgi:hypothetical protein